MLRCCNAAMLRSYTDSERKEPVGESVHHKQGGATVDRANAAEASGGTHTHEAFYLKASRRLPGKNDTPTPSSESSFSTEEEVPLTELLQGETLPRRWHVYTGVFDGYRSSVAVDGGVEKVTEYACAHGREPRNGGGGAGDGLLDGLSLGTDHFQLNDDSDDDESERPTKSYRQRSDTSDSSSDDDSSTEAGDDEFGCRGAMSEVVVVGGRLSDADIAFFERYVLRQLLLNSSCVRHLVVTVRVNICIQVFAGET